MTRRTPLHDFCGLRLSRRVMNALLAEGYQRDVDIQTSYVLDELRDIRGLGPKSLAELRAAMVDAGWVRGEGG